MEAQDLERRINETVARIFGIDIKKITPQSSLEGDLGADSLDQVELIMALEDDFDIEIKDEDTDKIKSMKDVYDYVGAKV
jgi:acyl carrier protein